jgi:hypothetical protein
MRFRRTGIPIKRMNLEKLPHCSDPDDQKFLELASASNADVLVSKDQALLELANRGLPFRIADPRRVSAVLLEKALAPRTLTFPSKKNAANFAMEYEFGRFFVRQAGRASLGEAVRLLAAACKGVGRAERRQPLHAIAVVPDLGELEGAAEFGRELLWRFVREAGAYLYILDPAALCRLVRAAVDLSRLEGKLVVPSAMVAFDFLLLERFNRAGEMPYASFAAR